jgi:Fic family protein
MHCEGELRAPVLSLSSWLTERAEEYRDHLLNVTVSGEWGPWIRFFAEGVAAEAKAGHDRIMRLLAVRDDLVSTVSGAMPRARLALGIAGDLIAFPFLNVAEAQRRHGRTNQANRNAINDLVALGILEQYGNEKYGRMYWNARVFHVIES